MREEGSKGVNAPEEFMEDPRRIAAGRAPAETDRDVDSTVLAILEHTPLLSSLPVGGRLELAAIARMRQAEPGERLVTEGQRPEFLLIVVSGEVEVVRQVGSASARHHIRRLGADETVGEIALLDDGPASASVYARTRATLLAVPLAQLRPLVVGDARFEPLFCALAKQLNARFRSLTDVTVAALEREVTTLQARVMVGRLLVVTVAVMSAFTFSIGIGEQLAYGRWQQLFTIAVGVAGASGVIVMIRRSGLPRAFWGFTTRGWRAAVRDALLYSPVMIALFIAVKWWLIHWVARWAAMPLFSVWSLVTNGDAQQVRTHLTTLALYIFIVVPLQEIVIRGCVQGTLEVFLTGPHRGRWAIVTSNLIFAALHSHLSPMFALITLIPGFFWGWLYARQRTLIGPMLSHALIGAAAMDVVGIFELLT